MEITQVSKKAIEMSKAKAMYESHTETKEFTGIGIYPLNYVEEFFRRFPQMPNNTVNRRRFRQVIQGKAYSQRMNWLLTLWYNDLIKNRAVICP